MFNQVPSIDIQDEVKCEMVTRRMEDHWQGHRQSQRGCDGVVPMQISAVEGKGVKAPRMIDPILKILSMMQEIQCVQN